MRKIEDIREVQHIALEIAKAFDTICKACDVPYYMLYGTMLGAARHEGFIPWDDDMDFGIEARDYERMVKALKQNLPAHYRCLTRYDKEGAVGGYIKIEDTRTLVKEPSRLNETDNTGVFIDVFLLYPTRKDTSYCSRSGVVKFMTLLQAYRFYTRKGTRWKMAVGWVVKRMFCWLKKPDVINFCEKHIIAKEGDCRTTYASIYNLKDIVAQEVYGAPKRYRFEDTEFSGVADAEGYLTHMYGEWRKLPPEEKRKVHAAEVYYKDEDYDKETQG